MNRFALTTMTLPGMAALGQFARSLVDLAKALRHRREIKHLAEFDERMLADIGLTRSDVMSALDEPLHAQSVMGVGSTCRAASSRSEKA